MGTLCPRRLSSFDDIKPREGQPPWTNRSHSKATLKLKTKIIHTNITGDFRISAE